MIEKNLIEDCKNGNLHNFRRIVEKISPMVYSVAFRMLGIEDTARDIVQDTMITVWQKLPGIKSADSFNSWIYRIAVNKCRDHLRRRKRRQEVQITDEAWSVISNHISEEVITELENKENAMIIEFLTKNLSMKQKMVFVLAELEDMSNDEIAEITGMYKSSVKSNLYYARKKIGKLLKDYLEK